MIKRRFFGSLTSRYFAFLSRDYNFVPDDAVDDNRLFMYRDYARERELIRVYIDNRDDDFGVLYYPVGLSGKDLPVQQGIFELAEMILLGSEGGKGCWMQHLKDSKRSEPPGEIDFFWTSYLLRICLAKTRGDLSGVSQ